MTLSPFTLLLHMWVEVDVLPLRGIAQRAHHVREALRGDGNTSQRCVTAMRHAAVRMAHPLLA